MGAQTHFLIHRPEQQDLIYAIENWKLLESKGKEGENDMAHKNETREEVWGLRKENTEEESATLEEQSSQI